MLVEDFFPNGHDDFHPCFFIVVIRSHPTETTIFNQWMFWGANFIAIVVFLSADS